MMEVARGRGGPATGRFWMLEFLGFVGIMGVSAFAVHEPLKLFWFAFFSFFSAFRGLREELKYLGLLGVLGRLVAVLGVARVIAVGTFRTGGRVFSAVRGAAGTSDRATRRTVVALDLGGQRRGGDLSAVAAAQPHRVRPGWIGARESLHGLHGGRLRPDVGLLIAADPPAA
jgi:hypothetical protein